jgi:TPR repeat protein
MKRYSKQVRQHTGIMETETIQKNGARPKSLITNRRNAVIAVALLCAALILAALPAQAQKETVTMTAIPNKDKTIAFNIATPKGEKIIVDWGEGKIETYRYRRIDVVVGFRYISHKYKDNEPHTIQVTAQGLTRFWMFYGELTVLDVSRNSALDELICSGRLTTLDVSKNPALKVLNCSGMLLTTLDVRNNPVLKKLICANNKINTLDVSKNKELTLLNCSGMLLTFLDVSENDVLRELNCDNNQLEKGNSEMQYNLGVFYDTRSQLEAAYWYKQAADKGYAAAQYRLAICYDRGKGVVRNKEEANKWYAAAAAQDEKYALVSYDRTKAAEEGDIVAQNELGEECYENGDYLQAEMWWLRALSQEYAESNETTIDAVLDNITRLYVQQGYVIAKYDAEIKEIYGVVTDSPVLRERAEKKSDPEALFQLGAIYYYGFGVERNYAEAMKWYTAAAKKKNRQACYSLGNMYYNGEGVAQDYVKAREWYEKASKYGYAKYSLANMYYSRKIKVSNATAKAITSWAYASKYHPGCDVAQYNSANAYLTDPWFIKNLKGSSQVALKYFKKTAEKGNIPAAYKVAMLEADKAKNPQKYVTVGLSDIAAGFANVVNATENLKNSLNRQGDSEGGNYSGVSGGTGSGASKSSGGNNAIQKNRSCTGLQRAYEGHANDIRNIKSNVRGVDGDDRRKVRSIQDKMRTLRKEAAGKGCTISVSSMENESI